MFYTMTITKNFGNKKSINVIVESENKTEAMFRGLAKAAKQDRYNFKHVQHWEVDFKNVKKILDK